MNKLAIIIPYYKKAFFKETLMSLVKQSDKRFSLYIGNDASPENPENLIQENLQDIPYLYFNYSDNMGGKNLALQWERILENVQEEWFQILGDDDIISNNFVEEFYKNLEEVEKNKCNVIKYSLIRIDDQGEAVDEATKHPKLINPIDNFMQKFGEGKHNSLTEHLFRKNTFDLYGFKKFPLAWTTDDLAILEYSENRNIFFIDIAHAFVRVSDVSISGKTDNLPQKLLAIFMFEEYIILNFYSQLPKDYLKKLINQQISYAYKNKKKLKINLVKLYLYLGDYKKLWNLPKTYYYLSTRNK